MPAQGMVSVETLMLFGLNCAEMIGVYALQYAWDQPTDE